MCLFDEPCWILSLVAGSATLLLLIVRAIVRRARRPGLVARVDFVEALEKHGFGGFAITAEPDSTRIELRRASPGRDPLGAGAPPAGSLLRLGTHEPDGDEGDSERPPLEGFSTGVEVFDACFRHRLASPAVARALVSQRRLLQSLDPFLLGWRGRMSRIELTERGATFVFRGALTKATSDLPLDQARLALPQMAAFAQTLISAATWRPPREVLADGYRGGAGGGAREVWLEQLGASAAIARPARVKLTVARLHELLREGRASWLSRVALEPEGTLQPLHACAGLADVLRPMPLDSATSVPSAAPTEDDEQPSPGRRALAKHWRAQHPLLSGAIVGAALFLLVLAEWSVGNVARGLLSPSWPTAQGLVTQADLRSRRVGRGTRRVFRPVVRYAYEVEGRRFTGHRVHFYDEWAFGGFIEIDEAKAIQGRYDPGQKVPVRYCRLFPAISVLEPGSITNEWIAAGVTLCLLLLCGRARWRIYRARRRAREARETSAAALRVEP